MKITVKADRFAEVIDMAQRISSRKVTIPELAYALLSVKKSGTSVTATDLDVGVRRTLHGEDVDVREEGDVLLPARRLGDILRTLPADMEVSLETDDKTVVIEAGFYRGQLQVPSTETYPVLPVPEGQSVEIKRHVLRDLVARTKFAVSVKQDNRYMLTGALMEVEGGGMTMAATDQHRLAVATAQATGPDTTNMILPRKSMEDLHQLLSNLTDETVKITKGENHIFFEIGDTLLTSRTVEGKFPNYRVIIPKKNDKAIEIDRAAFASAVKRVAIVNDQQTVAIAFRLVNGAMTLQGAGAEIGTAGERVPVEYKGDEVIVKLNPAYVEDFLEASGTEKVRMELKEEKTSVLFRPIGGDVDYQYVQMPVVK